MDISSTGTRANSGAYEKFNHDVEQDQLLKRNPQGAESNRGAILTQDSLDVPLEVLMSVHSQETESDHPSLAPLIQTAFADDRPTTNLSRDYYLKRIETLPPLLKQNFQEDKKKPLEERDPALVALDVSLSEEAQLVTFVSELTASKISEEQTLTTSQQNQALFALIEKESLNVGIQTLQTLDTHLNAFNALHSSDHPLNPVINQLKEALTLLNSTLDPK